ncbi:MAG: ATP-dependent DNA ligase [archaeon]
MHYSELAKVYHELESTTKKLEKRDIIAEFLKKCPADILPTVVVLLKGSVFPSWMETELGVAESLITKSVTKATGLSEKEIKEQIKKSGDIGEAVEELLKKKKQTTLASSDLTVNRVYERFVRIPEQTGAGSVDSKVSMISELLSSAEPAEGKYIVRTVLGEMRIGVAEGILREAVSKAFNVPADVVERAYSVRNDMGEIAQIAKKGGKKKLEKLSLKVGRPLKPMLAQKVLSAKEGIDAMGGEAAFEFKYDGMRTQIHKDGDSIKVFTRRLDDVTKQFPDIAAPARKCLKAKQCIVEGETVGVDPKTKKPQPFQQLSRRIKRKYGVEEIMEQIPVVTNLFDLLYLNGETWVDKPFEERRKKLEEILEEQDNFSLAKQIVTSDVKEAEKFYKDALEQGHEGAMIKNLKSPYTPGSRVKHMQKLKPELESLDLVIIGATWGEGRRANWLGSFVLGAREQESGEFVEIGRVGTGLSDADLEHLTELLKPLILKEEGAEVTLKPELVVEIGYEQIQRSPTYESGFALRFPRVRRIREDKGAQDADSLERMDRLYDLQKTEK